MKTGTSAKLFAEAGQHIPGGVNSPVRAWKAVGGVPRFIQRAKGSTITDVDGTTYTDYVGSWGAMLVGHAHAAVLKAVNEALANAFALCLDSGNWEDGMPFPRSWFF